MDEERTETNLNDEEDQDLPANEIREQLFRAIDAIVENRLAALGFDKTVIATIINSDNAKQGIYQVTTDDNITFDAFSDQTDLYNDLQVYVRIPQGDYTKRKVITNLYEPLEIQQNKNKEKNKDIQIETERVAREYKKALLDEAHDCIINDKINEIQERASTIIEKYKKEYSLLCFQAKQDKNIILPKFNEITDSTILDQFK